MSTEQPLTREELLAALRALRGVVEPEGAHMDADRLLLRYIDDAEIAEAFEAIDKWYS